METIKFQANKQKIKVHMLGNSKKDFEYMNDIKDLKKRIRYAVKHNEQDNICIYSFVSSVIDSPTYTLKRLNNNEFSVEVGRV